MPRTTLDIDDGVLRELKKRRARDGRPLGEIASELLARAIAGDDAHVGADFVWNTGSMAVRVDLDDKEAVRAALESP